MTQREELLRRTADFLESEAHGLKESHSLSNGEWYLVEEADHGAKRSHDEMLEMARGLRELVSHSADAIGCNDCDRDYGGQHGFPDLVVPNDVWKVIGPHGHEGGLLCPSCMCKRAHEAGLSNIPAQFTSGPFCVFGFISVRASRLLAVRNCLLAADTKAMSPEQEAYHQLYMALHEVATDKFEPWKTLDAAATEKQETGLALQGIPG